MKAIAINSLFIVITTVLFLFFAVVIIFGFINITGIQSSSVTCTVKLLNYCTTWAAKGFTENAKPYAWSDKAPKACSQFLKDIADSNGPTKDQCNPIVSSPTVK